MEIVALIMLAVVVGWWVYQARRSPAASPRARFFAWRFSFFTWIVGVLFVLAFLFLPNKGRVLMIVPFFLAAASLTKWWRASRERLRREESVRSDLERMKRIN